MELTGTTLGPYRTRSQDPGLDGWPLSTSATDDPNMKSDDNRRLRPVPIRRRPELIPLDHKGPVAYAGYSSEEDSAYSKPIVSKKAQVGIKVQLISENDASVHSTSESDASVHLTSESDASLHLTSESDASVHLISENDASVHSTSESDSSVHLTSESDASVHLTSESDASIYSTHESDASIYSTHESDAKVHFISEKDASVHSTSESDASRKNMSIILKDMFQNTSLKNINTGIQHIQEKKTQSILNPTQLKRLRLEAQTMSILRGTLCLDTGLGGRVGRGRKNFSGGVPTTLVVVGHEEVQAT
uniref:Uncharacterized protein n=1 Tax=Timema cristinae TaxID=61476 RepID=A0A7R9CEQ3_TIMCR|nr:unnamed protein product [Timema cristinae]